MAAGDGEISGAYYSIKFYLVEISKGGEMRKFLGVVVSGLLFIGSAMADISVGPIVGYGFGAGKSNFFYYGEDYEENEQGEQIVDKNLYYSAGQGIKMGLGGEYSVEGIVFGLDMGYSMGLASEIVKSKNFNTWDSTWHNYSGNVGTSFMFIGPNMKVEKTIMGFTPFCGFGFTIAMAAKSILKIESETDSLEQVMEVTHGPGIGGWGVAGIKYPLFGGLAIIGDIRVDQLSFKASHGEITKYTEGSEDLLAGMNVREKECDFREDDTGDTPSDTTKPCIERTFITPASSFCIRVGIIYSFKVPTGYRY